MTVCSLELHARNDDCLECAHAVKGFNLVATKFCLQVLCIILCAIISDNVWLMTIY